MAPFLDTGEKKMDPLTAAKIGVSGAKAGAQLIEKLSKSSDTQILQELVYIFEVKDAFHTPYDLENKNAVERSLSEYKRQLAITLASLKEKNSRYHVEIMLKDITKCISELRKSKRDGSTMLSPDQIYWIEYCRNSAKVNLKYLIEHYKLTPMDLSKF